MLKKDAIKVFGSISEMSKQLDISQSAISQWSDTAPIPRLREYEVREIEKKKARKKKRGQAAT